MERSNSGGSFAASVIGKNTVITIYTDGSCTPNPGRGGWAYVIVNGDENFVEGYGIEEATTNNRMELLAAIRALEACAFKECEVISDSQYVVQTINKGWKIRANRDLWGQLDKACEGKKVWWTQVRGHSSNKWNDYVDKLAQKWLFKETVKEVIALNREALEALG